MEFILPRSKFASHSLFWFHLVRSLPYLAQAYGAMESIEYRQGHGYVSYNRPGPQSIEIQLNRMTFRPRLFQRTNRPHRQIGHQQKRNNLSSRLFPLVLRCRRTPTASVQNEHRLKGGLANGREGGDQHQQSVTSHHKLATNHSKCAIEKQSRLGTDQQDVVQLEVSHGIVLQVAHLQHSNYRGDGRCAIQSQFANRDFSYG